MNRVAAEQWLLANASPGEAALRSDTIAGVVAPSRGEMWGPEDFDDWTRDDLVWRIVFLQCVLASLTE